MPACYETSHRHKGDSPATRTAYLKGKISTKTEIRKQMVMLARVGSAAVDMLNDAILDMEDDERSSHLAFLP